MMGPFSIWAHIPGPTCSGPILLAEDQTLSQYLFLNIRSQQFLNTNNMRICGETSANVKRAASEQRCTLLLEPNVNVDP